MKNSKNAAIKKNIKASPDTFSEPKNIKYTKDLVKDCSLFLGNSFCLIKSFNDILFLVYVKYPNYIIFFNLKNDEMTSIIKNAHSKEIAILKYYKDIKNKRDLLLTSSSDSIKLWNLNNLENFFFLNFKDPNILILKSCFLKTKNDIFIAIKLAQKNDIFKEESIQIYNLKKEKIKVIKDESAKDSSCCFDSYYHKNISYLILCNKKCIKVYNYNKNKWTIYYTGNENEYIQNFIIINNGNTLKMIGSSFDNIYLWNFQSGNLLSTFKGGTQRNSFFGVCLWNNDGFFIGHGKTIYLVKIKSDKLSVEKRLSGHKNYIPCIKKIILPIYGECLISQDNDGIIKLWANNHK